MNPNKLPNKFVIEFDTFHKITWRERVKLLLGFNIKARCKVIINKREGSARTRCDLTFTKELTAAGQVASDLQGE